MITYLKNLGYTYKPRSNELKNKQFTLIDGSFDVSNDYSTLDYKGVVHTTVFLLRLEKNSYKDSVVETIIRDTILDDNLVTPSIAYSIDEKLGYDLTITFKKER